MYCESFNLVKNISTVVVRETNPAVQCSWFTVIIFTRSTVFVGTFLGRSPTKKGRQGQAQHRNENIKFT